MTKRSLHEITQEYAHVFKVNNWENTEEYPILFRKKVPYRYSKHGVLQVLRKTPIDEKDHLYEISIIENTKPKKYHIFPSEYDHIELPTDTYNSKTNSTDDKLQVNSIFIDLLKKHPRRHRKVIYLDSPQLITTKHLVNANIATELHVPNILPDFKAHVKPTNEHLLKHIQFHHESIFELIRDIKSSSTYDFGFDYCCTLNGNNLIKPKIDLELAFHRQIIPKHNGVLWFTFSHRSSGGATEIITNLTKHINNLAKLYNYQNIHLVNQGTYKSVTYLFFVTSK